MTKTPEERAVTEYLWCDDCSWSGSRQELVAATDDLEDRDFSHCPNCGGTDFEEDEGADDGEDEGD